MNKHLHHSRLMSPGAVYEASGGSDRSEPNERLEVEYVEFTW